MKRKNLRQIVGLLMALVMVVGMLPMSAVAQDVYGTVYASSLSDGAGLDVYAKTKLVMDVDRTFAYMEGNYDVTVEGSGSLTIEGKVNVRSLNVEDTPLTVNGKITVSDALYVQSNYFYALGGIEAEDLVRITSSHAFIGGDKYGIYCQYGNIELNGSDSSGNAIGINVGAKAVALFAFNGSIALTGDILCNSNHKTAYCVVAEDDIYNGAGNYLNLTVTGSSGLISHSGDIVLSAGTIDVQATGGFAMMAESGAMTLDCQKLVAISDGGLKEDASYPYGIGALKDITVTVQNQAGIAGYQHGVYSMEGNISLVGGGSYYIGSVTEDTVYAEAGSVYMNGDFRLRSDESYTIYAPEGAITIEGSLDSEGLMDSPRNHDDLLWNDIRFTMGSKTGFDFYGTTLKIRGVGGISTGGDVSITADRVDTVTQMFTCVGGNNVYIDCDDLHLENRYEENSSYISPGIYASGDVTVYSDQAYICGDYGIYTSNYNHVVYTNLKGYFIVVGKLAGAISSDMVVVEGNLIAQNINDDGYSTITAFAFEFDGEKLDVQGNGGIWISDSGYIDINAKSTKIATAMHAPITATTGRVFIDSDYLYLVNRMEKDPKGNFTADGILASYVELSSSDGTVVGSNGINSTGNVNLYGSFNITGLDRGISADALYAETDRLNVSGKTGIYGLNTVKLKGNAQITSTGERNSGIWCENGYVNMEGNVTIKTNGWHGINAITDVTIYGGYYSINGPKGNAQAILVGEYGDLWVDPDMTIVLPEGGHINGNNINGAGDSPAQNLLMYCAVGTVDIMVSTPSDGLYPIWDSSAIYTLPPLSSFERITWFENGVKMDEDTPFTAGNEYSVEIILYADEGYFFSDGVLAKVNGKNSSMTGTLDGKTGLMIRADLGKCNTAIYSVDLDIAAPVDGNKPSTSVWTPDGAHYGVKSSNVRWMVSTDGKHYTSMASGEKFVGGKYYRVYMDVTPSSSKYSFAVTTENGFLEPNVWAMVGGIITDVSKAYDQDPEQVITVCYTFGKCNDKYIENIDIEVIRPVAGEHPSYSASVLGTGYHIDTSKNSYYDAYWVDEKWYFVKNGVAWWDVTDGEYDYVFEHDVFLPGHLYHCIVYLQTDDGYEFVLDLYAEPEIWPEATINGNTADVAKGGSNLMWNQQVSYTFGCQTKTVSTIKINGIDTPKAGNIPDYTATVDGSGCVIDSITWYDCERNLVYADEVFGSEEPYRVQICILPENVEGMDLVQFAWGVQVYINGREVVKYGQWDEAVVSGNSVWVYYTFNKGSAAPEGGSFVSGSVTSFGSESTTVTLQLLEGDTVGYETMVFGNSADYRFSDVAAGTYTLRVMKNNHISRDYTVVVGEGSEVLDVKICLVGDVTGDGKVNMKDWSQLYNHISEVSQLTDYNYLCADVTGEGKVNMKDWSRLYGHISETNPLW